MAIFLAVAAIGAAYSMDQQATAGRQSGRSADAIERETKREAARTEADLFAQVEADNAQRRLIADSLLLGQRAEDEARRQARQPGVEFQLGQSFSDREASTKRRRAFFDYESGTV